MTPIEGKDVFSRYRTRDFREHQEDAIDFITSSKKTFRILEAPTGSGKTLIGMAAGAMKRDLTYMVHTKILQNQVTGDFPEAKSLFGRANYPCALDAQLACGDCINTKRKPCEKRFACVYMNKKEVALMARYKILNYDYFLTEANHAGRFSGANFLVIDEADGLENTLINFVSLEFTEYSMRRLGLQPPRRKSADSKEGLTPWVEFAEVAGRRASILLRSLTDQLDAYGDARTVQYLKILREKKQVENLVSKIKIFTQNMDNDWIYDDKTEGRYTFRPLWMPEKLANRFLWGHGKEWVLMSASFPPLPILAKTLGIPQDEIDYKPIPSTFPVKDRQIHIMPVANLTYKTMDTEVPKLIDEIRKILDKHPNEKGLIHCVSYELGRQIKDGVGSPRLLLHGSKDRQEVLDYFMKSTEPDVLISPSMERGVSLDHDLCRFIIVAKAPFLSLGDKVVSARVNSGNLGKLWYWAMMLLTVLQMTGRGFRSADDRCTSYILDEQFDKVYHAKPLFMPGWWKEAVAW